MARIAGSSGPRTEEAIRRAGLSLIATHGYRDEPAPARGRGRHPAGLALQLLSQQAGIPVRPHPRPHARPARCPRRGFALRGRRRSAADPVHGVPRRLSRRAAAGGVHLLLGAARSLEPDNLAAVVAMRRDYERKLGEILDHGRATGEFHLADTRMATLAILAMLSGICTWYKPGGRLTTDGLQEIFTGMVLALARGETQTLARGETQALARDEVAVPRGGAGRSRRGSGRRGDRRPTVRMISRRRPSVFGRRCPLVMLAGPVRPLPQRHGRRIGARAFSFHVRSRHDFTLFLSSAMTIF